MEGQFRSGLGRARHRIAHNTFLDALLTFGIPGGAVMILLLFVKPLIDYLRAARRSGSRNFSEFCMMVIIFMTYNGMMESFHPQPCRSAMDASGAGGFRVEHGSALQSAASAD